MFWKQRVMLKICNLQLKIRIIQITQNTMQNSTQNTMHNSTQNTMQNSTKNTKQNYL